MENMFHKVLIRLRNEAGFSTAYKFFHENGGTPSLGFTYRLYLLMEQGKNLPAFENIPVLIKALKLIPNSKPCDELLTAWLRTMAGEKLFSDLLLPLIHKPKPGTDLSLMHKVTERLISQKKKHISPAQYDVIAKSFEHHLCYMAMTNDSEKWSTKALSEKLKLPLPTATGILKDLKTAKLIARDRNGYYFCPRHMRLMEHNQYHMRTGNAAKVKDYKLKLISSGKPTFSIMGFIRADMLSIPDFYQLLKLTFQNVDAYSTTKSSPNSALLALEGKITKLIDF